MKFCILLGVILVKLVVGPAPPTEMHDFTYSHQDEWGDLDPDELTLTCEEGKKQSPILIDKDTKVDPKLKPLKLKLYNKEYTLEIINTGKFALIAIQGSEEPTAELPEIKVVGGKGHYKKYTFCGCALKWGDSIKFGSEHRIGDHGFAAEFQCFHIKEEFDNLDEAYASGDPDAVVIIAWLFKKSKKENTVWTEIFNHLKDSEPVHPKVAPRGWMEPATIMASLWDLVPKPKKYYFYKGSTTTPGCHEVVNWYISIPTIPITEHQFELLKMVGDDPTACNNGGGVVGAVAEEPDKEDCGFYGRVYRYTQKLNKRKVGLFTGVHHYGRRPNGRKPGYRGKPKYPRARPHHYRGRGGRRGRRLPHGPRPW